MQRNNLVILYLLNEIKSNIENLQAFFYWVIPMPVLVLNNGGFIDNNDNHIPVPPDTLKNNFMRKRNIQDLIVCPRGRELLEFCIEANLSIMNSRTVGNMLCNTRLFSITETVLQSIALSQKT